jgi:hypothetical protein
MIVHCAECGADFDDQFRWTYCPHETFPTNDGNNVFREHPESFIRRAEPTTGALHPTVTLLAKLGSLAVHIDEFFEMRNRQIETGATPAEVSAALRAMNFDEGAIRSMLVDPELREWLAAMRKLAMIPERRS